MKTLAHKLYQRRFIRFLAAGGLAASFNFGSRFVYSLFASFECAVVLAFMTGLSSGYLLNKFWVFDKSKHSNIKEVGYYILINLLALLQTWAISVFLLFWLIGNLSLEQRASEAIAHLVGICFPIITSYIGHKYLTFKA